MKTKLFSLAVAVLGTPLLAHAVNPLTDGFCSHASDTAKTMINIRWPYGSRGRSADPPSMSGRSSGRPDVYVCQMDGRVHRAKNLSTTMEDVVVDLKDCSLRRRLYVELSEENREHLEE